MAQKKNLPYHNFFPPFLYSFVGVEKKDEERKNKEDGRKKVMNMFSIHVHAKKNEARGSEEEEEKEGVEEED